MPSNSEQLNDIDNSKELHDMLWFMLFSKQLEDMKTHDKEGFALILFQCCKAFFTTRFEPLIKRYKELGLSDDTIRWLPDLNKYISFANAMTETGEVVIDIQKAIDYLLIANLRGFSNNFQIDLGFKTNKTFQKSSKSKQESKYYNNLFNDMISHRDSRVRYEKIKSDPKWTPHEWQIDKYFKIAEKAAIEMGLRKKDGLNIIFDWVQGNIKKDLVSQLNTCIFFIGKKKRGYVGKFNSYKVNFFIEFVVDSGLETFDEYFEGLTSTKFNSYEEYCTSRVTGLLK